jgi:hypothetical protein
MERDSDIYVGMIVVGDEWKKKRKTKQVMRKSAKR